MPPLYPYLRMEAIKFPEKCSSGDVKARIVWPDGRESWEPLERLYEDSQSVEISRVIDLMISTGELTKADANTWFLYYSARNSFGLHSRTVGLQSVFEKAMM